MKIGTPNFIKEDWADRPYGCTLRRLAAPHEELAYVFLSWDDLTKTTIRLGVVHDLDGTQVFVYDIGPIDPLLFGRKRK